MDTTEIKNHDQKIYYLGKTPIKSSEYILNPRYYFYFYGIKILTLDLEMKKRSLRVNRPRAFVDIIMVNEILDTKYKLPKLDPKSNVFALKSMDKFYNSLRTNFRFRYKKEYTIAVIKNLLNKYK